MTRNKDSDSEEGLCSREMCYKGPNYDSHRPYYEKPNLSYSTLIAQAISESPERKLTLKEIYEWIMSKYPFFENQKGNWQNSIRHNLSLNKAFFKVPRSQSNPGKGSFWCVDEELFLVSNKIKNKRIKRSTRSAPDPYNFEAHGGMSSVREILEQNERPRESYENGKVFIRKGESISFNGDLQSPNLYFDGSPQQDSSYFNEDSIYSDNMFKFT